MTRSKTLKRLIDVARQRLQDHERRRTAALNALANAQNQLSQRQHFLQSSQLREDTAVNQLRLFVQQSPADSFQRAVLEGQMAYRDDVLGKASAAVASAELDVAEAQELLDEVVQAWRTAQRRVEKLENMADEMGKEELIARLAREEDAVEDIPRRQAGQAA